MKHLTVIHTHGFNGRNIVLSLLNTRSAVIYLTAFITASCPCERAYKAVYRKLVTFAAINYEDEDII